jgi:FHA domain-containing protein
VLKRLEEGSPGQEWQLTRDRAAIGRGPGSDVCLPVPEVSRVHSYVVRTREGFAVEDAGSQNGTAVNGARISARHQLHDGDIITVGAVELRVELAPLAGTVEKLPAAAQRSNTLLVGVSRALAVAEPVAMETGGTELPPGEPEDGSAEEEEAAPIGGAAARPKRILAMAQMVVQFSDTIAPICEALLAFRQSVLDAGGLDAVDAARDDARLVAEDPDGLTNLTRLAQHATTIRQLLDGVAELVARVDDEGSA